MPEEILECNERLLLKEVGSLTSGGTVNIEILAREGPPSETISLEAVQLKAKWVIAGMKGSGKAMRRIFGSTALSLSRHANVPLIVVPEDARFTPPKTIALASDIGDGTDVEIIEPLEEFGIKCNSTMYIVRVIKKGMDDFIERMLRPTRVKWHCKDLRPSFEFLNDNDVAHAMNEFVQEHHVSMVAMIAHEQNIFERIFVKSNIKEMMFSTKVPLIILPGKVEPGTLIGQEESVDKSFVK
jgi:hypothetical protein